MSRFKTLYGLAAVAAALVAVAGPARAALVIDQSVSVDSANLGTLDHGIVPGIYQEFHAGAGNIAGAGLHIDSIGGPDTLVFSIYAASDVSPTSHVATGPAIVSGSAAAALGWVDAFWSPVALTIGGDYFLNVESVSQFDNFSGSSTIIGHTYMYGSDYTNYATPSFRTYTETAFAAAAPEPASLALIGMGLIGVAAARRRIARRRC
jgi:hypothetical protein